MARRLRVFQDDPEYVYGTNIPGYDLYVWNCDFPELHVDDGKPNPPKLAVTDLHTRAFVPDQDAPRCTCNRPLVVSNAGRLYADLAWEDAILISDGRENLVWTTREGGVYRYASEDVQ